MQPTSLGYEDGKILTSPPLSLSAVACSSSGRVDEGSKAAFSVAAAASSEPDLEYSFGSGLRESLSWVSLRANLIGACEKGLPDTTRSARARVVVRRERRRVGRSIFVVLSGGFGVGGGGGGYLDSGEEDLMSKVR
jgi:hypothetical protein